MFWKDFLLKLLSLKSPHGGKPPLAPLTDRNKPAVWAATPREAGLALLSRPDVAKSVIQLLWSDLTAQVGAVSSCFWTSRDGAVFVWSCSLLQVKQLIRQLYNSFLRLQILGDVSCVHQCLAQVFPGRIRKHWQRCFSGN